MGNKDTKEAQQKQESKELDSKSEADEETKLVDEPEYGKALGDMVGYQGGWKGTMGYCKASGVRQQV